MRLITAYLRAWRGLCPKCNSEAPACDTCWVCGGYHGLPSRSISAWWLFMLLDQEDDLGSAQTDVLHHAHPDRCCGHRAPTRSRLTFPFRNDLRF